MNGDALLSPALAKALPERSKERALARLAMRQLWHLVFDPCPGLLAARRPQEWSLLEPFLEHAARLRLSMGWTLHGHLLLWLGEGGQAPASPELAQELLAACAARWAVSDQTGAQGLLLRFAGLPSAAVAAWKTRSAGQPHRLALTRLENPAPFRSPIEAAFLAGSDYPSAPAWEPLPL